MLNAIAIEEGSDYCYILEDGTWFNNTCDFLKDIRHREDFVDVEWEFVRGNVSTPLLRDKLAMWAGAPAKMLTVFLCGDTVCICEIVKPFK